MPYLDAEPAEFQRIFRLADADLPEAAVLVGTLRWRDHHDWLASTWPGARMLEERITLVEVGGRRLWFVVTFGAAMAATYAHLAAKLGARALVQLGAMGGLQPDWHVGDILVPSSVVGRDGVSRQLSRNRPIQPDPALSRDLAAALAAAGLSVRDGALVTTTTISFERPMDIVRWRRAGYAGVEMETAATMAVAQHYGASTAAALILLDNLAADHTVFHVTDEERARTSAAREPVTRAAAASLVRMLDGADGFSRAPRADDRHGMSGEGTLRA